MRVRIHNAGLLTSALVELQQDGVQLDIETKSYPHTTRLVNPVQTLVLVKLPEAKVFE